jgi:hypothetical protein
MNKRKLNCKSKKPNALSLLTTSALAIPGMVQATAVPEKQTLSVRYTQYQEATIAPEKVSRGNSGRYGIDVLQLGFFTPVQDKYSIDTSLTFETLSGASPYSSTINATSGQPEVYMSGATIEEKRLDASVNATRYFKEGTLGLNVAVSKENDYQSIGLGTAGSIELNDKHTTLLASISTSFDKLSPTDAELFGLGRTAADGKTKRSFSIYEGVTQVLNRHQTLQVGIGYTRMKGHLSDPYRFKDLRPNTREQHTLSAQYRHHLPQYRNVSWHLDYRLFQDSWGLTAHTIGTSFWKDINTEGLRFTLAPNLRYHWQHSADFYTLEADPTANEYYSDDFRLSAYGAITMGIDIQYHADDFSLTMGLSQYVSDASWGLTGSESIDTPALLEFTTFNLGLDYHF